MKDYIETASATMPVTARDGDITLQALIYAVAYIQTLPEERQEYNNMIDMCALARHLGGDDIDGPLWGVEDHVGHEINLWPAQGGGEMHGLYTDEELVFRDKVRALINEHKVRLEAWLMNCAMPPHECGDDLGGEAA